MAVAEEIWLAREDVRELATEAGLPPTELAMEEALLSREAVREEASEEPFAPREGLRADAVGWEGVLVCLAERGWDLGEMRAKRTSRNMGRVVVVKV